MTQEATMIKVTNIPDGTSKDALLFFFENRRKSGGGSVEDLEYDPDTKSSVITFEEPEAVKRVIGKSPLLFNGVHIGVDEFRPDVRVEDYSEEAGEDSENILEVRGVSSKTSEDVMMYFENARRSGGGEIKSMKAEDGVFYIIFEDDQAIEKVLNKQHKIDGKTIEVCRYIPPPPKPVPMYSNKVFVTNISKKTAHDGLENFLEAKTNITPASIEYGELEGTALITFEEDIDFEKLQLACKKRTLDKSQLEIFRVPITNCAIVRNISERTSLDTLEFYFGIEKRSGVSGVMDVKMLDGFCLVYFEEPEEPDSSNLAMYQHYIECQTCGRYSEFYCNACHQRMCGNCRDEHVKNPDNTKHEVCNYKERKLKLSSIPCKLHPSQLLALCCKKCQQAICALCTIKEHEGHGFLDLEEVYTKHHQMRLDQIRRIRDDIIPQCRVRLKEATNARNETKENVELL